jgi:hypothetical protein
MRYAALRGAAKNAANTRGAARGAWFWEPNARARAYDARDRDEHRDERTRRDGLPARSLFMEDFDETLFLVWRANLKVLTGSPGGAGRLARMMNFSPSFMKLIVAGQRDFNEEFVRGIELVTGLPPHWMDDRRAAEEVPAGVQRALDEETPVAVFRGTAHPQPKRSILRGPEPLLSQTEATRRVADIAQQQAEANRRDLIFRKNRELLSQDLRRLERQLSLLQVDTMQPKVDELLASDRMSEAAKADLSGRLEQVDKHVKLLHQHVEKLVILLSGPDDINGGE